MNKKLRTISALLLVIITIGILGYSNRTVIPKKSTWEDVVREAKTGNYQLILVDDLCDKYLYVGMERDKVIALLGNPDANNSCYVIRDGWADPWVFEIYYDNNNKLVSYDDYSG